MFPLLRLLAGDMQRACTFLFSVGGQARERGPYVRARPPLRLPLRLLFALFFVASSFSHPILGHVEGGVVTRSHVTL